MQEKSNGYYPENEEREENINWREIIENYLIHWKWIVASVVVFLIAGGIYYMKQPKTYEFKAQVLIIDPNSQMTEMSIMRELSNIGFSSRGMKSISNNEELVIKSEMIMKRVVSELNLHTSYFHKDKLRLEDIYNKSPYFVECDSSVLFGIENVINFTIRKINGQFKIEGKADEYELDINFKNFPKVIKLPTGNIRIYQTQFPEFAKERIYVNIYNPEAVAKYLVSVSVKTEVNKLSDDIMLTCTSAHQQKGKDILNMLIRFYNKDAVEQINQTASFSSIFIDERLKILNDELNDVEKNIENYKKSNELTDVNQDAKIFLQENSEYYNKQIEVEIQIELLKDIQKYFNSEKNRYKLIPDIGIADKGLIQIIGEYNKLLLSRNDLMQGGSENNPTMHRLNQQLADNRESIFAAMNNSIKALQITKNELLTQNNILKSKLKSLPQKEREYVDIQRQQQVKAGLYVFLLQKREEASLSMAIATNKARVLNTPELVGQVAPNRNIIMLLFFMLGLILPIGFIYVRNLLNTKIINRSDLEKLTQLPVLTELAHNKTSETLFDHDSNEVSNAELFRLLRAKLQFVLDYPKEKVILVTSTQPGEGKTFVSVNLAVTLSMMEKKVLLVGLDLRKPMVSKILGIENKEGITSYLSGQLPEIGKLIQEIKKYPGLSVLPAGIIPPNPNELLVKDRFVKLFEVLKEQYDYIVLDTAPVGAVSDTFVVDKVADICLYVCRSEFSDKRNIDYINRLDREGTLKRIHLIINDVEFESKKYAYYRKYGYGYGYGYGYSYGYSKKKSIHD
jgi:capsular exopolysaccharide synthesis family protein